MKKISTLIALALACSPLLAQFSITAADMPQVGDSRYFTAADTTGIDAGASGAGVTWNYATLAPNGSNYTINYNAPNTHAQASNYPAATLVEAYTNAQYRFLAGNADSVILEGEKSVANTPVIYTDKSTLYVFPMAFGYYHTDSVYGSYFDGFFSTVDRKGQYTVEIDADGSLTTPFATYPNVNRVKTVGVFFDSSWTGAADANVVTARYEWYQQNTRTPVMVMNFVSVSINGGAPQLGKDIWYADNNVGIDAPASPLAVTVTPSIVREHAQLSYTLTVPSDVKITLLSSTGAVVGQVNAGSQASGVHALDLPTQGFASGMYLVRVEAGTGSQTKKFIVQ